MQSQGLGLVTPDCKICFKATLAFCKYSIELVPFVNMCFGTVWSHSVPYLCVLYLFWFLFSLLRLPTLFQEICAETSLTL